KNYDSKYQQSFSIFNWKDFDKKTTYLGLAEVAKASILWVFNQAETIDYDIVWSITDGMEDFPTTFDDPKWFDVMQEAVSTYDEILNNFFYYLSFYLADEMLYELGFAPEGSWGDIDYDYSGEESVFLDGDYIEEATKNTPTISRWQEAPRSNNQSSNNRRNQNNENVKNHFKNKFGRTKNKFSPAGDMMKDAFKQAGYDALVSSLTSGMSSAGREVSSSAMRHISSADSRRNDRLESDPLFQLKDKARRVKKELNYCIWKLTHRSY
ncbi:MAG: hypothetical protein KAG14_04080, partial [Mycoplasmataceae bacterium]|nr:hypothetical protein [Mycoplasmataceae bacterium]